MSLTSLRSSRPRHTARAWRCRRRSRPSSSATASNREQPHREGARISWWSLSLLTPVRVALSCPVSCPGGVLLDTPLLMPMSGVLERNEEAAEFMDTSGGLVQLPFDLKVPFARYVCWRALPVLQPPQSPLPNPLPLFQICCAHWGHRPAEVLLWRRLPRTATGLPAAAPAGLPL